MLDCVYILYLFSRLFWLERNVGNEFEMGGDECEILKRQTRNKPRIFERTNSTAESSIDKYMKKNFRKIHLLLFICFAFILSKRNLKIRAKIITK